MRSSRSRVTRLFGAPFAVVASLVVGAALAAPASAAFVPAGSFSSPGSGAGQMNAPGKADLRLSDGRLFVADENNHRVQVFAPAASGGTFETSISDPSVTFPADVALDQETGELYVAGFTGVFRFNAAGTLDATFPPLPFDRPRIAFDQAADELVVADFGGTVRRYSRSGLPGATFDGSNGSTEFFLLRDVAVDSTGDVIVVDATGHEDAIAFGNATSVVERYSAAGAFEAEIGPVATPATVAVESGTDRVVVGGNLHGSANGQPLRVSTFTPAGQPSAAVNLTTGDDVLNSMISGVAIGAVGGRMYAITRPSYVGGTVSVQAYDNVAPPEIAGAPVASNITGTGADVTVMVDPNGVASTWVMDYSDDGGATWNEGATGTTGSEDDPVGVTGSLTGLEPHTEHLVRLRLPDVPATSAVGSFETVGAPPRALTQAATQITTSGARLIGAVDPQASPTVYWFEYGTSTDYGSRIPATDVAVGDSNRWEVAMQTLTGLQADVTYHYRVVARNGEGTTVGEDRTFVTSEPAAPPADGCPNVGIRQQQGSSHLPDCRAYEQVSPSQKYNGGVTFGHKVSDDGNGAGFMMNTPLSEEDGGYPAESYGSRRGPGGWKSKSTALPMRSENRGTGGIAMTAVDYSDDFSQAWIRTNDPIDPADKDPRANGGGLTGGLDIYRVFLDSRSYQWESRSLVEPPLAPAGSVDKSRTWGGRSRDGRHVFFHTAHGGPLVPGAPIGQVLYESFDGQLRAASVLPDGVISTGATATGGVQIMGAHDDTAVSDDGSRVYWIVTAGVPGGLGDHLYLRENGTTTKRVSVSRRAADPPNTMARAMFLGASSDGDIAYFTSTSLLTEDATAGGGLYRYDADADSLTFLVRATSVTRRTEGGYNPDISESGDRVYFVTNSALTPDAPLGRNLYLWDGELKHVAAISPTTPVNDFVDPRLRVSRDGRYAAFSSTTSLDPRHVEGKIAIYRYDAETGELDCASCPASGVTTADGEFRIPFVRFTIIYPADLNVPRNIADDGSLFFQTKQALANRDNNGNYDVYKFDGERTQLITSGKGTIGSEIADNSDDGKSVFFVTPDSLTGTDIDNGFPDMYVARVGGGFPEPPTPPAPCSGDGCQDGGAGPPARRPLSTGTLAGDGNVKPARRRAAKLRVRARARGRGRKIAVRVRVSSAGRVTARGALVKKAKLSVRKAGARRLRVVLNAKGRRALARRGKVKAGVRVAFKPRSGARSQRRVVLTYVRKGK